MPVSQKVSTLVAAWLLCLNVRLVLGGWERTCSAETIREPPRGHFCGKQLSRIVSTVCRMQGGYYSGSYFFNKRSTDTNTLNENGKIQGMVAEETFSETRQDIPSLSFLLPKSEANSVLGRVRRSVMRRGIVCECCYHRCNLRELNQYCAGGAGKRSAPSSPFLSQLPIQGQFALNNNQHQDKASPWRLRTFKKPKV